MTKSNSPGSIAVRARDHHARTGSRCGTPRCGGRVRPGVFGRCDRCTQRKQKLGSYEARSIRRSEYANEWSLAHKLIHEQRAHPAIISGLQFLSSWIEAARRGDRVPGGKAVQQLADRGATAEQILTEVLAVELRRKRHPGPTTDAPFLHGNAMLRAYTGRKRGKAVKGGPKPWPVMYVPSRDRAAIQKHLFDRFVRLFIRMHEYFDAMEALRNAQIHAADKIDTAFPVNCDRCRENARKAAEKAAAGKKKRSGFPPGVDGRSRASRAAGLTKYPATGSTNKEGRNQFSKPKEDTSGPTKESK